MLYPAQRPFAQVLKPLLICSSCVLLSTFPISLYFFFARTAHAGAYRTRYVAQPVQPVLVTRGSQWLTVHVLQSEYGGQHRTLTPTCTLALPLPLHSIPLPLPLPLILSPPETLTPTSALALAP